MNPSHSDEDDYINFVVATPKSYSGLEAGRVQPLKANAAAPEALIRMLHRKEPHSEALWQEANSGAVMAGGLLELDDTTLDKPYAKKRDWGCRHWSGKPHQPVRGINRLTLLRSDGEQPRPVDYRIDDQVHDNLSKNDHFRQWLDLPARFQTHLGLF